MEEWKYRTSDWSMISTMLIISSLTMGPLSVLYWMGRYCIPNPVEGPVPIQDGPCIPPVFYPMRSNVAVAVWVQRYLHMMRNCGGVRRRICWRSMWKVFGNVQNETFMLTGESQVEEIMAMTMNFSPCPYNWSCSNRAQSFSIVAQQILLQFKGRLA